MSVKRNASDSHQSEAKRMKVDHSNFAAGTIKRISLTDFMCHDNLILDPNPNINFITGANGAGKSSILQAVVLGLGGDSKHTKRYASLGSFVKKGSAKAVIDITLNNQGDDAFKPQVYGDSLIFERTIRDNGKSCLVLKDANGNVKMTKGARDEGKRALDSLRVQVENPVSVLQQEEAKEFLKVESPGKLYGFFENATMLKQIIDQYKAGFSEIDVIENNVKSFEDNLKMRLKVLTEKEEVINRVEERDEEWERLTTEYAWADVKECGEKVNMIEKSRKEKQNQLKIPKERLRLLRIEEQELKDSLTKEEMEVEEKRNLFRDHDDEISVLNEQIADLKQGEKASTEELRKCDESSVKIKDDIATLEEQLQNILGHSAKDKDQVEKEKLRQIMALERDITEIKVDIEKKSAKRLELNSEDQSLNLRVKRLDQREKEIQLSIDSSRKEIKEIEKLGDRNLAVYGKHFLTVGAEILNNVGQFEQKPFGPVGCYVQLKSPAEPNSNLANLAETLLSSTLTSYLCHSDRDRRTLTTILDRIFGDGTKPKIFVSRFLPNRHQVKRANVQLTLMDLLEIEEVAIFNFLVDQAGIESVAVCTTQDEAKAITTHRNRVPQNLIYAVTTDFYQFMPPSKTTNYRSYCIDQTAQGLLSGCASEKLRQKRIILDDSKAKLKENNRARLEIKNNLEEIEKKKDIVKHKSQELHKKLGGAKNKLKDLKFRPENDTSENLVEKLTQKKKEKKAFENRRVVLLKQKSTLEMGLKSAKEIRDSKTRDLNQLKEKWSSVDSKFSQSNVKMQRKLKEIATQEQLVKKVEEELQECKRKREDTMMEWKKSKTRAEKMTGTGEAINPSESKEQLNAKIQNLKEKRDNGGKDASGSNLKKIKGEYSRLKEEFIHRKSKLKDQKLFLKQIKEMNKGRRDKVLLIRRRIVNMVTRKFNHFTREMAKDIGCNIFLRIDSQERELRFAFASENGTLAKTDVSSLSGGEKSFAQMALICSLWEHMQPPFRCLDEWDVFLDQLNRKKIQNKLLKFALNQNDKQFLFLSPQGAFDSEELAPREKNKVSIIEIKKN